MKILILVLVGAVGIILYRQEMALVDQGRQLRHLSEEVKTFKEVGQSTAQSASLETQARCSEYAKRSFKEMNFKSGDSVGFDSHYNPVLNKCFLLVEYTNSIRSGLYVMRKVQDAIEGKLYGQYDWISRKDKSDFEVRPMICEVLLRTGEKSICESDKEFEEAIKYYMGK